MDNKLTAQGNKINQIPNLTRPRILFVLVKYHSILIKCMPILPQCIWICISSSKKLQPWRFEQYHVSHKERPIKHRQPCSHWAVFISLAGQIKSHCFLKYIKIIIQQFKTLWLDHITDQRTHAEGSKTIHLQAKIKIWPFQYKQFIWILPFFKNLFLSILYPF